MLNFVLINLQGSQTQFAMSVNSLHLNSFDCTFLQRFVKNFPGAKKHFRYIRNFAGSEFVLNTYYCSKSRKTFRFKKKNQLNHRKSVFIYCVTECSFIKSNYTCVNNIKIIQSLKIIIKKLMSGASRSYHQGMCQFFLQLQGILIEERDLSYKLQLLQVRSLES